MAKKEKKKDPFAEKIGRAAGLVRQHPLFLSLINSTYIHYPKDYDSGDLWARVTSSGTIYLNRHKKGSEREWAYVIAHCLLHLGLGHFKEKRPEDEAAWNTACCSSIEYFLDEIKMGVAPQDYRIDNNLPHSEDKAYQKIKDNNLKTLIPDMEIVKENRYFKSKDFEKLYSRGIKESIRRSLEVAAGRRDHFSGETDDDRSAQEAKQWFMSNYPLLASLSSRFEVIYSREKCQERQIPVAAVYYDEQKIYVNPLANLSKEEMKFVLAHEMLHVGLHHDERLKNRDPLLFNISCDYLINSWLLEMNVGRMPEGLLYDPKLKGMSSDEIYSLIAKESRKYRKLAKKRETNLGDFKFKEDLDKKDYVDLDEYIRRSLYEGMLRHKKEGRGFLPADLEEEITALRQSPPAWDVSLAKWFDRMFPPKEKERTYRRLSRRQGATPEIPRPVYLNPDREEEGYTFSCLLDTSGSMSSRDLAKALGAIRSYAISRDVEQIRLVYCDARPYDAGYISSDALLSEVKVRGRGGTRLQPAINLIENMEDFPKDGPVLIITDGWIDQIKCSREHAYLLTHSGLVDFKTSAPIFQME